MFLFRVLCLSVCSCLVFCESDSSYRLSSTDAIPTYYSLKISPDFDNDIFYGEVSIYVKTNNCLKSIILHSSNLTLSDVQINNKPASYEEISDQRIKIFYENDTIQPGEQLVYFNYSGIILSNNGFIKATYEYKEENVYIYVTDLEPIYARRVFPCFDEPSFKANFSIRLVCPNETYKAISNMPEIENFKRSDDNRIVHRFATSVKMSTYLLSFAFTGPDYTMYEDFLVYNGTKTPIRIYTVNASKENNEFALNCTRKALEYYSNYTNIYYPMPKLDMIEYKRNLTAATENWGLITLRQGLLTPSLKVYNKYQIKLVAFHELSHFWFGNLVSNNWWSDLWLQEGFATYMSYRLMAKTSSGNREVVDEMRSFSFNDYFEIEIYGDKPPVVSYLPKHADIESVFNDLVYYKGAAVLLMLEDLIGEEKFQQAIIDFLKSHQYSTVTTNDFISIVEGLVTELPIRTFLESFLYQRRYPVITVDIKDDHYVLSQQPNENVKHTPSHGEKWTIPITYQTDVKNASRLWFDKDMENVKIPLAGTKWILFNPRGISTYRTILSDKLWNQIIENFEEIPITATETVSLDLYYSFRLSKINCDIFIKLIETFSKKDRTRWIYFHGMSEHIKDNLHCQGYKNEADRFWAHVLDRMINTGYIKKKFFTDSECDTQYIQTSEDYKNNLGKCAKWIQENLKDVDIDSNAINMA